MSFKAILIDNSFSHREIIWISLQNILPYSRKYIDQFLQHSGYKSIIYYITLQQKMLWGKDRSTEKNCREQKNLGTI